LDGNFETGVEEIARGVGGVNVELDGRGLGAREGSEQDGDRNEWHEDAA
jgi:hypothetical protein